MDPYRKFPLMKSAWSVPALMLLVLLAALHLGSASAAEDGAVTAYETEKVVPFEFNGDLRDLPEFPLNRGTARRPYRPLLTPPREPKLGAAAEEPDFSEVSTPLAPMPSPIQNFAGLNFSDLCGAVQCGAGWPPDINGDVGLNHYIVAVNDAYAIYSKTGTLLTSFTENQLWSTGGSTPCNGNSQGDPIVLYDPLADRWILTHFAFATSGGAPVSPFFQCIAASKTNDPVSGGWWLFPVRMDPGDVGLPPVGALNDYGKFGVWSDCLYGAFNEFQAPSFNFVGTAVASFSRSDLYSGAPLTMALGFINNSTGPFTMIPSNLSGRSADALPAGTPNYFVSESTTLFTFEVRKFTAGPNCGGGGTLSAPTNVSQTSYTVVTCTVVPQPGTTNLLDSLGDRLMQKVQYNKVGSAESLWAVHTVRSSSTSTVRPQWAQIDVTGGVVNTTPVQQQIYAPDTTLHRWMPSLAVDNQGNMALGYSTSDGSSNFPSIAYSGRLVADPLNTLPQTEVELITGAGSQTNTCGGAPCHRWGDYTAMSVDPVDECTFWYTNEYYSGVANGATGNWQTRVGSFKFPSCTPPLTITHTLTVGSTNPNSGVAITVSPNDNNGQSNGTTQFARTYNDGTDVTLTAPTTAGGNNFAGWNDCDSSVGNTCNINLNGDKTATARFMDTMLTCGPPAVTNSISADFCFTSTEAGSTFECSLDLKPFTACTSPQNYPKLKAGNHHFEVRAKNVAGTDPSPANFDWTIDNKAPNTSITSGPPVLTNNPVATFTFTSTEVGGGFQCSLDGSAFAPCTSPFASGALADGKHNFQVKAVDAAGNIDKSPAKAKSWTVDTTLPVTTITAKPTNPTTSPNVKFKFTSEKKSTFQCSLDGSASMSCKSGQKYSGLLPGPHNFQVQATDAAQNVELIPVSFDWTIIP